MLMDKTISFVEWFFNRNRRDKKNKRQVFISPKTYKKKIDNTKGEYHGTEFL